MTTESPKYQVLLKADKFEVRKYAPLIVAETVVDGDFDTASSAGFRRLAGYIFGGNHTSEKIAMTAPVSQFARKGGSVVTFSMPSSYTLEMLPAPNDKGVSIRAIPEKTYATVEFSGTWSQVRYDEELASLKKWIGENNFSVTGDPNFARYNPPWTIWFLRRNEILIEIKN